MRHIRQVFYCLICFYHNWGKYWHIRRRVTYNQICQIARYCIYSIYRRQYMAEIHIWHFCRGYNIAEGASKKCPYVSNNFLRDIMIWRFWRYKKLFPARGSSELYFFLLIEYNIMTGYWTSYINNLDQEIMYASLKSAECKWKCTSTRSMNEISGAKREHGVQYRATDTWSVLAISSGFTSMKISVIIPCFVLFAELVLHEKEDKKSCS